MNAMMKQMINCAIVADDDGIRMSHRGNGKNVLEHEGKRYHVTNRNKTPFLIQLTTSELFHPVFQLRSLVQFATEQLNEENTTIMVRET